MEDYELYLLKHHHIDILPSLARNITEERKLVETYHALYELKKENDAAEELHREFERVKKQLENENKKKPEEERKKITGSMIRKIASKPTYFRKTIVKSFVNTKRIGKYSLMIKRCSLSVGKYENNKPLYIFRLIHPKIALRMLQAIISDFEGKEELTEEKINKMMRQNSFIIIKIVANQKKENLRYGIEDCDYLFRGKRTSKLFDNLVKEAEKEIDEWIGEQFDFLITMGSMKKY